MCPARGTGHLDPESAGVNPSRDANFDPSFDKASPLHVAVLSLVTLLWATYAPGVRYIYSDAGAPEPVVLTALKTYLACVPLLILGCLPTHRHRHTHGSVLISNSDDTKPAGPVAAFLNRPATTLVAASAELGLYNLIASWAQIWGLALIPATTAGFVIQSTTIFTPLLAVAAGNTLARHTQIACLLASIGTVAIGLDAWEAAEDADAADAGASNLPGSNASQAASLGILVTLFAAACHSMSTFRISRLGPAFSSVRLAAGFTVAKSLGATVAVAIHLAPSLRSLGWGALAPGALWPGFDHTSTLLMVLWVSLGPGALATALQVYGQGAVAVARAQVIFTGIPLWSAAIAWFCLQERTFGTVGWLGAALILAGGLIVAAPAKGDQD